MQNTKDSEWKRILKSIALGSLEDNYEIGERSGLKLDNTSALIFDSNQNNDRTLKDALVEGNLIDQEYYEPSLRKTLRFKSNGSVVVLNVDGDSEMTFKGSSRKKNKI